MKNETKEKCEEIKRLIEEIIEPILEEIKIRMKNCSDNLYELYRLSVKMLRKIEDFKKEMEK
jgi:vacuolar-type H+-ATPase subunit E/Vma4